MTTPQGMLELADELEALAEMLSKENTGSDAGFDRICIRAATALRLSASPAGNGGREEIARLRAALEHFAERADVMPKTAGDSTTVHFRLRDCREARDAILALTTAVAPDGAREALEHLGNALYFCADVHPEDRNEALNNALAYYNAKMPRCKVEPSGHGYQRLTDPDHPAVVGIEGRIERALFDALNGLIIAYGATDGRNGNSGECWDKARAAIALARHPHQPVEDKRAAAVLREMLKAYDSGNLQMSSPEIGEPENDIPYHPWHEEFLHHARAAIGPEEDKR